MAEVGSDPPGRPRLLTYRQEGTSRRWFVLSVSESNVLEGVLLSLACAASALVFALCGCTCIVASMYCLRSK